MKRIVKDPETMYQEWAEAKHAEFYAQQERDYYESLAKERSRIYRIVDMLVMVIGNINDKVLKYREKLLRDTVEQ